MKRRLFTQSAFAGLSILIATSAVGLSGCGFKLRGAYQYAFKSLLSGFAANSALGNEFKRLLDSDGQVLVLTDAAQVSQAQVVLDVLNEQREKVVVGTTASGQVREFQLRQRLRFKVRTPDGKELIPEAELLVQRDISYNESVALGKAIEEDLLYRDMQSDMVQQLLRRLAAIKAL